MVMISSHRSVEHAHEQAQRRPANEDNLVPGYVTPGGASSGYAKRHEELANEDVSWLAERLEKTFGSEAD